MSETYLSVESTELGYIIAWVNDVEIVRGVGEEPFYESLDPDDYDSYESFAEDWDMRESEVVARNMEAFSTGREGDSGSYIYKSKSAANKVLSAINLALKKRPTADDWENTRPPPPWASEALSLGWTPPSKTGQGGVNAAPTWAAMALALGWAPPSKKPSGKKTK